jgi:hypothetical protein
MHPIGGEKAHCLIKNVTKDSAPMAEAASPNQVGGANGERDQHGRTARGFGGGSEALPDGRAS